MATIVTRAGKGSALTHNEVDANFNNLNNAKYESGNNVTFGTIEGSTITATTAFSGALNGTVGATTPAAGTFTNLAYTGTLTGGTGVINIGSGQVYKDASGNVGVGTSSPAARLVVVGKTALGNQNITSADAGIDFVDTATTGGNSIRWLDSAGYVANLTQYSTGHATLANVMVMNNSAGYRWSMGGSERMRIDSSGNVGIGTSSPLGKVVIDGASLGNWSSSNYGRQLLVYGSGTNPSIGIYDANSVNPIALTNNSGAFVISRMPAVPTNSTTAPIEYMRIDSSGNLLVGTTSSSLSASVTGFSVLGTTSFAQSAPSANANCVLYKPASAAQTAFIFFNTNDSFIASITQNGNSAVSYNTTSDYRLKNDVTPMENALEKVALLKPVNWKWKVDGSHGEGFIAHELAEVIPYAVTGEKDAVDKDGKPVHQGVDTSFLVATLTKAIQELNAKVTALEAQLQRN